MHKIFRGHSKLFPKIKTYNKATGGVAALVGGLLRVLWGSLLVAGLPLMNVFVTSCTM